MNPIGRRGRSQPSTRAHSQKPQKRAVSARGTGNARSKSPSSGVGSLASSRKSSPQRMGGPTPSETNQHRSQAAASNQGYACHWKSGFWHRANATPDQLHFLKVSQHELPISSDLLTRLRTLEDLDAYIVQHPRYIDAVADVIKFMIDNKITLNHVECFRRLEELNDYGCMRTPIFQCMLGYRINDLDKGDLYVGGGYYHFSRVSVGTMRNSPQFALTGMTHFAENSIMFFIDPHVFTSHHFMVGHGNPTKGTEKRSAGKLNSMMTNEEALEEALRAVSKLSALFQQGIAMVPLRNEIAVFKEIDSRFVYPYVAVLEGCQLLSVRNRFAETRVLQVKPSSRRYDVGKRVMQRSLLPIC